MSDGSEEGYPVGHPEPETLKKKIRIIEKNLSRSSDPLLTKNPKFISIRSKFERNSSGQTLPGSVVSVSERAKFFDQSQEEREKRLKESENRRFQFRKTRSSFEFRPGSEGEEDEYEEEDEVASSSSSSSSGAVLGSIFHRKDSEAQMAKELKELKLKEDARIKQREAFASKVSMFGKTI